MKFSRNVFIVYMIFLVVLMKSPQPVAAACRYNLKCDKGWVLITSATKYTCVRYFRQRVNIIRATHICGSEHNADLFHIPDKIFNDAFEQVKLQNRFGDAFWLNVYYDSRIRAYTHGDKKLAWYNWARSEPSGGKLCVYYSKTGWRSSYGCVQHHTLDFICEKRPTNIPRNFHHRKVKLDVELREPYPDVLYENTRMLATCTFVGISAAPLKLYLTSPFLSLHRLNPTITSSQDDVYVGRTCLTRSKVTFIFTWPAHTELQRAVQCQLDVGRPLRSCGDGNVNCYQVGPWTVIPSVRKPDVKLVYVPLRPNIGIVGEPLVFNCKAYIRPGSTLAWMVEIGGVKDVLEHNGNTVQIPKQKLHNGATLSNMTLIVEEKHRRASIICNSRPQDKTCRSKYACQVSPRFLVTGARKPRVTLVKVSCPPNLVLVGDTVEFTCEAYLRPGNVITWMIEVDGVRHAFVGKHTYVHISSRKLESGTTESNISINVQERHREAIFICSSRPFDRNCVYEYACQIAPRFQIVEDPGSPKLIVHYDRPPATVFKGKSFEATCEAKIGDNGHLSWALFSEYRNILVAEDGVVLDTHKFAVKIVKHNPRGTNVTSILRVINATDLQGQVIVCFSSRSTDSTSIQCTKDNPYCQTTSEIKVVNGPSPPKLSIYFDEEPSFVNVGTDLLASCTANVGDEGVMTWTLTVNDTVLTPPVQRLRISESTAYLDIEGHHVSSVLKIPDVTTDINGMVIACFSYDIRLHPGKMMKCTEGDPFCRKTFPLRVQYQSDYDFDFGLDKLPKYLMLSLLWFVAVLFLHLYSWFGFQPCVVTADDDPFENWDDGMEDDYVLEPRKPPKRKSAGSGVSKKRSSDV